MSERALADDDIASIPSEQIDVDAPVRGTTPLRQWDVTAVVAIGAVIGAEARYGLALAVPHATDAFPWSTVYINVIGCFCLGLLMSLLSQLSSPHRLIRPFIGIGILGGFTTFSTFTVDAERLIQAHRAPIAGAYILTTLVLAALAVAAATVVAGAGGEWLRRRRRAQRARQERPTATGGHDE